MNARFVLARVFWGGCVKFLIVALGVLSVLAQDGGATAAAASVKITQPFDGQEFLPGEIVHISAEAVNPNGNVHVMGIYDGTNLIYKVDRTWQPDQTQPMKILFSWGAPFFSTARSAYDYSARRRWSRNGCDL